MNQDQKKQLLKLGLPIILSTILLLGISYAWLTITLNGTKTNVLKSGTLSLVLDDTMGEGILIENSVPMYDTVGLTQVPYTFTLTNDGTVDSEYTLYLDDMDLLAGETRLPDGVIKYNLTRDDESLNTALLSSIGVHPDRILDTGVITPGTTYTYHLRLWLDENMTNEDMNKVFRGKIRVVATQVIELTPTQVILMDNPVQETKEKMFNYTSLGTTKGVTTSDPNFVTNGVYAMEDDDGTSYYFRGNVNNLVKFGEYKQDYYVYRYIKSDFPSLEACKFINPVCSESNKVLKYPAGTPMYWKIIRINGDSTIRMIYSGTTPDATGTETGVGFSRYNESRDDPKHAGYTYDNGTDSKVKIEVDNWYNNALAGSKYDSQIATGKFCSDTSNYRQVGSTTRYNWASEQRLDHLQNDQKVETVMPTLKCPVTTESYGGSYKLKAGLITADEMVLAGGEAYGISNKNYYLYSKSSFWSMTPTAFSSSDVSGGLPNVWYVDNDGILSRRLVNDYNGVVRPVINLNANVLFTLEGDGSTTNPYVVK